MVKAHVADEHSSSEWSIYSCTVSLNLGNSTLMFYSLYLQCWTERQRLYCRRASFPPYPFLINCRRQLQGRKVCLRKTNALKFISRKYTVTPRRCFSVTIEHCCLLIKGETDMLRIMINQTVTARSSYYFK